MKLTMAIKTDLLRLLIPSKRLGSLKLGEEDAMCIKFSQYLRELTLTQDFPYIWFHVPNQFAIERPIFGLKQSWMGRISGIPDYVFLGKKSFAIEFKSLKGRLSPNQQIVKNWFEHNKVDFYIAYSFEAGKEIIKNEWI